MNSRTLKLGATLAATLLPLAMCAGCGGKGAKPQQHEDRQQRSARNDPAPPREWRIDRPEPTTMQSEARELPVEVKPTLVKRGPAPLVYIVETPSSVAVVDLNTQQRLGSAPVPARTIVRVEARSGVMFGEQHVSPGPLPAEHQYGIYLEPSQTNEIRNQTVGPAPRAPHDRQRQPQQPQPQQPQQVQPQTRPQ